MPLAQLTQHQTSRSVSFPSPANPATDEAAIQSEIDAWQSMTTEFEVKEPEAQIVLVCELRAAGGEAVFAKDSLVLWRRSCETGPLLSRSP